MKLKDQAVTILYAKRLKELGMSQDSLFSWFGDEEFRLRDNGSSAEYSQWLWLAETKPVNNQDADWRADVSCTNPIAAAFTVAELGVMLPPGYDTMYCTNDGWRGFDLDGQDMCDSKTFDTEAEARAAMLIYLLETNIITPAEVNVRLKATQ
jgi:hypothetical protein